MGLFSRPETSVLMVCRANICRSPMAEGVLRGQLLRLGMEGRVRVDSAGTHAGQTGRSPDPRAQRVCSANGINIKKIRSRQIGSRDFETFTHILAMDAANVSWLVAASPQEHRHKISHVGAWTGEADAADIPDPYYGNEQGFSCVFTLLQPAIAGFVASQLTM